MGMDKPENGGPAFPCEQSETQNGTWNQTFEPGMSLHDYFAGQALSNPVICTGTAHEYELRRWFGERGGVTRYEIAAAQASDYADAMLAARTKADTGGEG
jgi:hypothetical protein